MSGFSDVDIRDGIASESITCLPLIEQNISVASIDLRLDNEIMYVKRGLLNKLFPRLFPLKPIKYEIDRYGKVAVIESPREIIHSLLADGNYILYPGDFIKANTIEIVGQQALDLQLELNDKSTFARDGLSICFSAGYVEPGNVLRPTLEIANNGSSPIELQYGQHICQARWSRLETASSKSYHGKYYNSMTVEAAK